MSLASVSAYVCGGPFPALYARLGKGLWTGSLKVPGRCGTPGTHVAKDPGLAGAGVLHGGVRNFVFPYGPNIWLKCCKYFSWSAVFELYLFIFKRKKCTYME